MVSDKRQSLISEIKQYQSEFEAEETFKTRILQLLQTYPNCFERSLLLGHVTASAWVLNHSKNAVLLLHHAKLNKWLQPGGHADGNEDVRQVALKEAEEETGISGFEMGVNQIFDIDIHTIPKRKSVPEHEHFDIRFMLIAPKGAVPSINHESNAMEWVPIDELEKRVQNEPSLFRMYLKTNRIFVDSAI